MAFLQCRVHPEQADESPVWAYTCHPGDKNPQHQNQNWIYNETSKEIVAAGVAAGSRLDVANYGDGGPGSVVWIFHKTSATNQQWQYNSTTGQVNYYICGVMFLVCTYS